ncbi:hypothetical protein SEA_NICEHOUSE_213 [Rhodococcus phage NiceHouse]|nr:hypothetical protein SEA_NICEHOUSE_213 [Rhodococcus phage NiceHouse]
MCNRHPLINATNTSTGKQLNATLRDGRTCCFECKMQETYDRIRR